MPEFPTSGINYLPNNMGVLRFLILAFPPYHLSLVDKSIPLLCSSSLILRC